MSCTLISLIPTYSEHNPHEGFHSVLIMRDGSLSQLAIPSVFFLWKMNPNEFLSWGHVILNTKLQKFSVCTDSCLCTGAFQCTWGYRKWFDWNLLTAVANCRGRDCRQSLVSSINRLQIPIDRIWEEKGTKNKSVNFSIYNSKLHWADLRWVDSTNHDPLNILLTLQNPKLCFIQNLIKEIQTLSEFGILLYILGVLKINFIVSYLRGYAWWILLLCVGT